MENSNGTNGNHITNDLASIEDKRRRRKLEVHFLIHQYLVEEGFSSAAHE
jgi:hypothetical protein